MSAREEKADLEAAEALAGMSWLDVIVTTVIGYLLKQAGEIASYDPNVSKQHVIAVARCTNRWRKHDFKRKP